MKKKCKNFYFRPDFYFETPRDFCLHLGYSADDVAKLTGVTPRTARRWLAGRPPRWLLPFLYAVSGGVISCDSFYGWQCRPDGYLYVPGLRTPLTASQVHAMHWTEQTLSECFSHIRHLERELRQAKEKPDAGPALWLLKSA